MSQIEKLRAQIIDQKPTKEQQDAIFAVELEFLLRASPGSGKTWTSCRRFIWRGANWEYSSGGLALLSFTNAAIREFHEATIKVDRRGLLSDPNYVGTFDSFVERFIITPFGHLMSGKMRRPKLFISPRPGDWNNRKLMAWTELSSGRRLPVPAWEIIPFIENNDVFYKASSGFGGKTLIFDNINPIAEFFNQGLYTHAQRVFLAYQILLSSPHIATCIARRFPEIIVDEAQDTNIWLLILLDNLRDNGSKITLVGDPDQCIYEFSMAVSSSLKDLKESWKIPEKPLKKSFRCNNPIAESVRFISGNKTFVGCGDSGNEFHRPFVLREPKTGFSRSVAEFERLLGRAEIPFSKSAILCRGLAQLEKIRGIANYINFQGLTKEMARAVFYRDVRKDYKKAFQIVEKTLREMVDQPGYWEDFDENSDSVISQQVKQSLWIFTKSPGGLPSLSECGSVWIDKLKVNLTALLTSIGITNLPQMGTSVQNVDLAF